MTYSHKLPKLCSATLSFTLVGCWQNLDLIYVAADQVVGRLDYQPLITKMSRHSSPGGGIKDRTRDTAEIEPSQWTSSNKNLTTALFCHVPESMVLSSNSGQYITHFIRFSLDGMDKFIFAQVTTQILLLEIKY